MKRTNLVLDEEILNQVLHFSKKKTYSEAVMTAMNEYVRINEFNQIFSFQGSGVWDGDLTQMRKDTLQNNSKKSKQKKK